MILFRSMWILPSIFYIFSYLNSAGPRNSLCSVFHDFPFLCFVQFIVCYCVCLARDALLMMTQSLVASSAQGRNACRFHQNVCTCPYMLYYLFLLEIIFNLLLLIRIHICLIRVPNHINYTEMFLFCQFTLRDEYSCFVDVSFIII